MGKSTLNKEKFVNAILYITKECSSIPHFGKTDLYKTLYFSDFDYYEMYEEHLTGESYYRIQNGPAPSHFSGIAKEMIEKNQLSRCKLPYHGYRLEKYIPQTEPDLSLFEANEIKVLDSVIEKISGMNATQVSEYSHQDMPYKATKPNRKIDYELVFYRDPMFSVREYKDD